MTGNKYKFLLLDFSFLITRNLFVVSKDKKVGEYTAGEVERMCLWSINKLARDFDITADKVVMIYDRWSKEYNGYYTTYLLGGQYKDSRKYMTEEIFEEIKANPESTEEDIKAAELELYKNQVKYTAKWGMIRDFGKIGMSCIGLEGWEADNFAWLFSSLTYGQYEKPSILVTKDSDWSYLVSPTTYMLRWPKTGETANITTYDEMYYTIPEVLRNKGISLYVYKAYVDSLDGSHNDMRQTRKNYADLTQTILEVMDGNFSNVEDVELFKKQFNTFDISKYPRFEEAKRLVTDIMPTCGKLGTIDEFHSICDKHGITGVSDRYFTEFISRFDPKLYCER